MEVLFHLHCHLFTCYNFRCFSGEFEEHNIWKVPPHRKLSCIIVNQIFPSSWWQVSLLNGRTAASSFWKIGVDLSNGFSPTTTSLFTHTHAHPLHVFGKLRKVYFLRNYWHMFIIFTKVTQCKHVFFSAVFSTKLLFLRFLYDADISPSLVFTWRHFRVSVGLPQFTFPRWLSLFEAKVWMPKYMYDIHESKNKLEHISK